MKLNDTKWKYSTHDKEFYAIVMCTKFNFVAIQILAQIKKKIRANLGISTHVMNLQPIRKKVQATITPTG